MNFCAVVPAGYTPLVQPLVASSPAQSRTNVQEKIFILSRQNQTWTGVGYVVANSPQGDLDSLYRFTATTKSRRGETRRRCCSRSSSTLAVDQHEPLDGRRGGPDRARLRRQRRMDDQHMSFSRRTGRHQQKCSISSAGTLGQIGFAMFSNTLPASVEIEMGVLEDRALQRAESLSASPSAQSQLSRAAGRRGSRFPPARFDSQR